MTNRVFERPQPTPPRGNFATKGELQNLNNEWKASVQQLADHCIGLKRVVEQLQKIQKADQASIEDLKNRCAIMASMIEKNKRKKSAGPKDFHEKDDIRAVFSRNYRAMFDIVLSRSGAADVAGLEELVLRFISPLPCDFEPVSNNISRLRRTVYEALRDWPKTDPKGPPFIHGQTRNRYVVNPKWES